MKIKYQLKVFMPAENIFITRGHKMKTEIGYILKHSSEVLKEHFKDILGYSLEILKIFILLMK